MKKDSGLMFGWGRRGRESDSSADPSAARRPHRGIRRALRGLVCLSFVFLLVALYRADYLRVPRVVSIPQVLGSLLLLFSGFLLGAVSWWVTLGASGFAAPLRACIAGCGLTILGKYVPGKVWAIAGRAAYLASEEKYPLAQLSMVSLRTQVLELWSGLTIGIVGLYVLGGLRVWGGPVSVCWVVLTVFTFTPALSGLCDAVSRMVLRRPLRLAAPGVRVTLLTLPWFLLSWSFWGVGFYLLAQGLSSVVVDWSVALGLPFSVAFGVLAIFAPGGIGVREGCLAGYMVLAGIPVAEATTVAVASRLWFLTGELFMFAAGYVSSRLEHRS